MPPRNNPLCRFNVTAQMAKTINDIDICEVVRSNCEPLGWYWNPHLYDDQPYCGPFDTEEEVTADAEQWLRQSA